MQVANTVQATPMTYFYGAMQAKEAEVRTAIAHQSALEKDRLRQSLTNQGDAVVGPGLPQDAPGLAGELNAIEGAKRYAHSLQVSVHACNWPFPRLSLWRNIWHICRHICVRCHEASWGSAYVCSIISLYDGVELPSLHAGACCNHQASGEAPACL